MKVIEVNKLIKRYGDLLALDHLDLTVREGEIYGLLGPNGSGKTTAINSILSLLTFDQGEISIFGKPMKPDAYDIKAKIGVVPQEVAVFEELNVSENIDYFAGLYEPDRATRRQMVEEAIEFTGLQTHRKFLPKKLSGGLKRRLNIACGIAHRPKLIFLDEPTVAVDAQSRQFILDGIRDLADRGSTVVYTTHYLDEAEQLCDRIGIIDHGRKLAEGTLTELKDMIEAKEVIHLELPHYSEELITSLRQLPDLLSLEHKMNHLALRFRNGRNHVVDLVEFLNGRNEVYLSLYSVQPSLNDVFLELTGRDLRE